MKYLIVHRLGQTVVGTTVHVKEDSENWDEFNTNVTDCIFDENGEAFGIGSEITITRIE